MEEPMAENTSGAEKPQNGERNNNRNHKRKHYNGPRKGGNNNRTSGGENKPREKRENSEGRQGKKPRDGYQRRDRNRGPKQPRENQGQVQDAPKTPVKKREETVEDIRSENARITKEIYLDIAAMKNISLD